MRLSGACPVAVGLVEQGVIQTLGSNWTLVHAHDLEVLDDLRVLVRFQVELLRVHTGARATSLPPEVKHLLALLRSTCSPVRFVCDLRAVLL